MENLVSWAVFVILVPPRSVIFMIRFNKPMAFAVVLLLCGSMYTATFAPAPLKAHSIERRAEFLYFDDDTRLWEVMYKFGKIIMNMTDAKKGGDATRGRELVYNGYTTDSTGRKTSKTGDLPCIACHTVQPEHEDLGILDPEKRLAYADSMQLPFLPGAPFYGLVNRVYFFNNDYQKNFTHPKHQELITKGHKDLRTAIQACNRIYAHGRELAAWEVESILEFLWTLQLHMRDIKLSSADLVQIREALATDKNTSRAINLLRDHYPEVYPATLPPPMPVNDRKRTSPVLNNFTNGRRVYERSCLYCHGETNKYASPKLNMEQSTFQFLKKHCDDSTSRYSMYEALRYQPKPSRNWRNSRSPHYTKERMSDKQIQDLRFYVLQMAKFGDEAYEYYKNNR